MGISASKTYNLAINFPNLINEWNYEKNAQLTPELVTSGSPKSVWWKCKYGHEWKTRIGHRTRGSNCPHCRPSSSRNELRMFSEFSYFFSSTISQQQINGFECDIYIPELKLAIEHDGVYFHKNEYRISIDKNKNEALKKEGIELIRVREKGLEKISELDIIYNQKVNKSILLPIKEILSFILKNKIIKNNIKEKIEIYLETSDFINDIKYLNLIENINNIPFERSLLYKAPEIAKEWHITKNGNLKPENVSYGSDNKAWFQCSECNYEWQSTISNRSIHNRGCAVCAGKIVSDKNSIIKLHPELIKDFNFEKNSYKIEDLSIGSEKNIWWKCNVGHEWQTTVNNRVKGSGCPYCSGYRATDNNSLVKNRPDLIKEFIQEKNIEIDINKLTLHSSKKIVWTCYECGDERFTDVAHRIRTECNCTKCRNKNNKI